MPASAMPSGTHKPADDQHEGGERIGEENRKGDQHRPGDRQHGRRRPTREQAVERIHALHDEGGELPRVRVPQGGRAGVQQPPERVRANAPPRRRPRREGRALGEEGQDRAGEREQRRSRRVEQARELAAAPDKIVARTGRPSAAASTRPAHAACPIAARMDASPRATTGHWCRRASLICCRNQSFAALPACPSRAITAH